MATRQPLQVGISIGATDDGATSTIQGIVDKANTSIRGLAVGLAGLGVANKIQSGLTDNSNEFAGQQYSLAKLRILEMDKLGHVNEMVYGDEEKYIRSLSSKYAKTVEDYTNMVTVMRQNRLTPQDILGGVGESGAKLGKAFDNLEPKKSAVFFSRLKNDMHVNVNEMDQLANMAYKLYNVGIGGGDANVAVTELTEAFGKSSLGAANLGMKGAADAEEMGILMGTFIAKGLSGGTVGTNFRRIFDSLMDPQMVSDVMQRALQFGVKLRFYDKNAQFLGLKNFEDQLAKMQNLNALQRKYILKPLGGKQGLSNDFEQYLSKYKDDVTAIRSQYENTTSLNNAVGELVGTLQIQNDKTESAKKNMKAAFGKATAGDVQRLNELLQWTYNGLADIASTHPSIAAMTQEFLGMAGGALVILSALKLVGNYIPIVANLANGFGASLSWVAPLAAAALILREGYETGDAKGKLHQGGLLDRNMQYFNDKMAENNAKDNLWGKIQNIDWIRLKALNSLEYSLVGNNTYESVGRDFQKNGRFFSFSDQYDKYSKWENQENQPGPNKVKGVMGNYFTPDIVPPSTTQTITYAPQFILPQGIDSVNTKVILDILDGHSDKLMKDLKIYAERQKNLTYGR